MFLSLWLFVEFVFLEKKQVRLSDLKVTAFIIIAVSSTAVRTAGPNRRNIRVLTFVQLVHRL